MVLLEEWHIQLLVDPDQADRHTTAVLVDTCGVEVHHIVAHIRQQLQELLPGVSFHLSASR
ncbi:MAG: hypothetical protein M0Z30_10745 [Actinomycetota bacterium]|nr:hypothetical protein [Actinomycetota bacterium]